MNQETNLKEMYEYHMERVYQQVGKAKSSIEDISVEIENTRMSDEEVEKIDNLVLRAIIDLDGI